MIKKLTLPPELKAAVTMLSIDEGQRGIRKTNNRCGRMVVMLIPL